VLLNGLGFSDITDSCGRANKSNTISVDDWLLYRIGRKKIIQKLQWILIGLFQCIFFIKVV